MNIWEADKLLLFIAFVVPGFISIKAYQVLFPSIERTTSSILIDAIGYSSINYALIILLIITIIKSGGLQETCPFGYYILFFFALFIAPIFWVLLWKFLRTRNFSQNHAPHPTIKPWDYVFSQREPYWVKITLMNGSVIAGYYADKSFTSSAPAPEQIYLEETWILNKKGGFDRPKTRTAGVIILADISHIELMKYNE